MLALIRATRFSLGCRVGGSIRSFETFRGCRSLHLKDCLSSIDYSDLGIRDEIPGD